MRFQRARAAFLPCLLNSFSEHVPVPESRSALELAASVDVPLRSEAELQVEPETLTTDVLSGSLTALVSPPRSLPAAPADHESLAGFVVADGLPAPRAFLAGCSLALGRTN